MNKLKDENTYFILFLLLGGICGISIWLIIDKEFISNMVGIVLFGLGFGGLLLASVEKIVDELKSKPEIQKNGDVK